MNRDRSRGHRVATAAVANTYATWNPTGTTVPLSNGNLTASISAPHKNVLSTIGKSSGKWYVELTITVGTFAVGIAKNTLDMNTDYIDSQAMAWVYWIDGQKFNNNTPAAYGATFTAGDIISIALDMDAGTISMRKNGADQGVMYSGLTETIYAAMGSETSATSTVTANFGASAFAYAVPSGYNAGLYS